MARHRESTNSIIFIVPQETNMKKDRKRVFNRKFIAKEEEKYVARSCLFREGEILDFNLVPSFPNYFHAFTSLLLPAPILKNASLVFSQSSVALSESPKQIGITVIRSIPCILVIALVLAYMLLQLNALLKGTYSEKRELYNYIMLPNHVLPVLMRVQLLNIVMRKQKSIFRVFGNPELFGCYDERPLNNHNMRKASIAAKTFVYGFVIIGIMVVGTDFGWIKMSDWTLIELLETNANYIREELIFLASENNATTKNSAMNASEEGIQLDTVVLGILGCTLQLLSFLTSIYIGGAILFASLTMKEVAKKLIILTKSRRTGQRILVESYEFLFQSTFRLNNDIGGLLALFHIQTFLFFVLFLRNTIVEGEILDVYSYVCFFPNIAVTVAAYYYAALTPIMMDTFRTWVRKRGSQECLGVNEDTIQNLLDEMNTDPNGIGKGVFYVNADLIAKITSSIGAFFLVVAPQNKI